MNEKDVEKIEGIISEIEELIDNHIGHGKYTVDIRGAKLRAVSVDIEQVWENLKSKLQSLKSRILEEK